MGLNLNILILSYHYHPDLSAGSFKNTALVAALRRKSPPNTNLIVITTLPSRYNSFSAVAPSCEYHDGLTIHRVAVPANIKGLLGQCIAFLIYAFNVIRVVRKIDIDLVYASSSRLMTACLGAGVSKIKQSRFYVDFRDIFLDAIKDVLPYGVALILKPSFSILEKLVVGRASKINLVSYGFHEYFASRYPARSFSNFTNGIDEEFRLFDFTKKRKLETTKLRVVYAGNIGQGQGLHFMIPALAKKLENKVNFIVIGDGAQRNLLEAEMNASGVRNVELFNPVKRNKLKKIYAEADVLFLHLNNYEAFLKVLPSKIFEYAATGKPIWAGVSGYAAEFLTSEVQNVTLFQPCDVSSAVRSFKNLQIRRIDRTKFINKHLRSLIMDEMAFDILETKR